MYNAIISPLRQALLNRLYVISIATTIAVMFIGNTNALMTAFKSKELLANGFHAMFMKSSFSTDSTTLCLPIISALPYTVSFVDDIKSGYIKEYLPRTDIKGYISGKITACYLSGGLSVFIGLLIAYGISFLVFAPMEAAPALEEGTSSYFSEFFSQSLLFFFSGGLFSLIGMTSAAMANSKYMAYSSPFIFCYILIILKERYFNDMYVLYPKEWLAPSDKWLFGNSSIILLLIELAFIVSLCFCIVAKRRLSRI